MVKEVARRFLQALLGVLACVWFMYSYHRYLPHLNRPAFKEILYGSEHLLKTSGCLDILIVLWIWVTAYLVGRKFIEFLGLRLVSGAERLVLSSAAGISLLSLFVFTLAALGILYKAAGWGLLILPTALWFSELRVLAGEFWLRLTQRRVPARLSARSLGHGFIIVYITVVLALILISALGPALEFDDLIYHLPAPKAFVKAHGVKALPDNPHTFLPKNIEMLFALGMLLHSEITAKLINYLIGLLALLSPYAFAARFLSRSVGLVAMAILASSPILIWEMRTAHVDSGLTLYVFLSVYAIIIWLQSEEQAWFRLGVYFMAFALGIKYQAFFALVSAAALVFLHRLICRKGLRQATVAALRLGLLSTLGLLPWGVVNFVYTGNPLFPLLNNFFHSPYWTQEMTDMAWASTGERLTLANWWTIITAYWQMLIEQSDRFQGNIGPFFLMLIPFLLLKRKIKSEIKLILTFSLFYSLIWHYVRQHGRYFLPVLPGLAIVAAYTAVSWLERGHEKTPRLLAGIAATLLALMALFNLPLFEQYGANARCGLPILATFPLKVLLGYESKDEYLTRHVGNYPVLQYLNQLPGRKKVFFWWNTEQSAFYLESEAAWIYWPSGPKLFSDDPNQIHCTLRENGITHLVVGPLNQDASLLSRPEGDFVRRYLRKIYQKNAVTLYEVVPEPVEQETVFYDFLSHIDEAKLRMPFEPPGKANSQYRGVLRINDKDSRYSLLTFPPAEVEYTLTLCQRPVLKFAVGQGIPHCSGKGSFQIWMVAASRERRKIYERVLDAENKPQDRTWFEEQVDLDDYAHQRVSFIFKTELLRGGGCSWYQWADPVIMTYP